MKREKENRSSKGNYHLGGPVRDGDSTRNGLMRDSSHVCLGVVLLREVNRRRRGTSGSHYRWAQTDRAIFHESYEGPSPAMDCVLCTFI